jgi:hypothetical protein
MNHSSLQQPKTGRSQGIGKMNLLLLRMRLEVDDCRASEWMEETNCTAISSVAVAAVGDAVPQED